VTVASRESAPPPEIANAVDSVHLNREDEGALDVANGYDLVVDVVPFTVAHAEQLLQLDAGALVAISSASVYADDAGNTLDEAESVDAFPDLPVPIPETQRTVEPGEATYSTNKRALELRLLESGKTAAIVRPCAIYGPGDRMAREWHFIKRALDKRPYMILTGKGQSRFHTTASSNIGELVRCIARNPRTGVYNSGDPDPPMLIDLARRVSATVGHEWEEILLPTWETTDGIGETPFSVPKPLVIDMQKAETELGYRPATTWNDAIDAQIEYLVAVTRGRDWKEVLNRGAQYMRFDYDAEDAFVHELKESAA
jgi:nucleoside-diphosphate-sugar epimerase